jgi:isopentenyldiphosphate isomerase
VSSNGDTTAQQNDPDELLEVFDARGRGTGVAKSRAPIHLDGDWHQAFHCWIVRSGSQVVLQRRSLLKDTFAGFWDASAAGHWRFGESAAQASREVHEELGLSVPFSAFRYGGRERIARTFGNGLIDREHHQVYVLRWDAPLSSYRPDPAEVIALAAVSLGDLVDLLAHRREAVRAAEAVLVEPDGSLKPATLDVHGDAIVPYSAARMRRILGSA